jgi:hypothetical protein
MAKPGDVSTMTDDRASDEPGESLIQSEGLEFPPIDPRYYVLQGLHARGGQGRILRAWDARLRRVVAVKELLVSEPAAIDGSVVRRS